MTITFFVNGRPLTSVTPEDTSYRYRKISGEDRVYLTFVADRLTTIPVGATIRFEGATYTLLSPAVITKHNNKSYHHSLTLGAPCERLRLWRMKHRTDGAVKFNLTAKPEEHLRMLIDASSGADTEAEKWTIASCLDAPEKLISYDHTDCLSALGLIAKTFDTEWVAEGKAIRLGKIEANATSPLPLAYGKDKGLKSGLKRENDQRQTLIQRLYVRGSDRNIRHDRYGSKTLHMPKSESVFFDGDRFSGEAGYNTRTQALYLVSPNGDYVERVSSEGLTGGEGSLDATDIYPSRVGSVTSFEQLKGETKDKHPLFAFTDTSIPASLDYTQCLIPNQPLTIAFQSGMLAGQTFESEYTHKDRRFTIIGKEVDGVWMPEAPYIAKAGDKYAVFSVELPAPYIRDNNTKTGAEWELLRRALKHLHEATQHPYVYRADLDGLWAKKDWTNRGGAIRLGGYVRLSDPELIPYGVDLRITGIKDYLISPETPEIELGTGVSASSILTTIEQMGARQEEAVKEVRQEISRNYKQALEASEQIARATAERFSSSISPATIKTMQLIAGDPQTQLRFKTPANWTPDYNKDTQVLRLPAGQIEWLYNPSRTLSSSEPNAGKVWALPEMRTPALSDPNKSYYIYARCNNGVGASLAGAFVVDTNPRELNDGSATCLLLGLLSSADETGARSFSRLYGFTEVLPSQIRTERIASADGSTTINLNTGEIVSDKIKFVHPDGAKKSYPSDYLHEAIQEGTTEIQGGVVLSTLVGAKDTSGKIRSYISGKAGAPALAAGVKGLEEGNETYQTAIHHDGSADFGYFHIRHPHGQGAVGSHLYLENYRYRDSPDIENPYAVKIGDTHPDLKVISRGKLTEDVVVALPEVKLTGLYGSDILYHRAPSAKEVEVIIQPQDLGRYVTSSSKVDVTLTFIGRVRYGNSSKGFLAVSASPYPSYPAYSPEERLSPAGGSYSFSGNVNPDGSLSFYLIFRGDYVDRESQLNVRANIRVTSDSRRDRGTYLTQSGFLVFHDGNNYINADRSRLPYVDAVSGAIRNAGNVMLEVAGGLRVKGDIDTSGILLSGRVDPRTLRLEYAWGAKKDSLRVERIGRGMYKIQHTLGHTRYNVVCNAAGNGGHNASYVELSANYFTIRTNHDNGVYDDIWFSFIVIGDNY